MRPPTLVAHRGQAATCPENTRLALGRALAAGAAWVETDVQLSADRVPVLFHDRDLARLCGRGGAVHELAWSELAALPCPEPGRFGARFASERIARLADLVELLLEHPAARAFVELKRAALERFGPEAVLERTLEVLRPVEERCALISFSLPLLERARTRCRLPLGAVFDRWEEREQPIVARLAPEFVFCDLDGLPAAGELRHPGARTAVYEVAEPELARSLAARGVELVETFDVERMLAALGPGAGHA